MFALEAQMQPSASRQIPSGPTPAAQTRPVRQCAVVADVEGGQACGKGLGEDKRLVVRRDDHAVRERERARDLAGLALRRDERDLAGRSAAGEHLVELFEVEVDRVDVGVAPSVDGDLAPPERRDVAQIGVPDARSVRLDPDQLLARDEHPSVREPVRRPAESIGAFPDHLALAVEIDGDDLARSPVRKPQATLVPPRGLGHGEAVQKYARLHWPSLIVFSRVRRDGR
jgi:hypothetical protein